MVVRRIVLTIGVSTICFTKGITKMDLSLGVLLERFAADDVDHAVVMFYNENRMVISFTTKLDRDGSGAILKEMRELGKKYQNEFVPIVTGTYISFYATAKYEYESLLDAISEAQICYDDESDGMSVDEYVALAPEVGDSEEIGDWYFRKDFAPDEKLAEFLDEIPKYPESIGCMGYDDQGRRYDDVLGARRAYLAWATENAENVNITSILSEKTLNSIG